MARSRRAIEFVGAVEPNAEKELVVADDGSIPAEKLARLGLRPGAHLRVVEAMAGEPGELKGLLPELPDLAWKTSSGVARRPVMVALMDRSGRWIGFRGPRWSPEGSIRPAPPLPLPPRPVDRYGFRTVVGRPRQQDCAKASEGQARPR